MAVIASLLPTFPTCPGYQFTSRPTYLVSTVTRRGGYERRDRKWSEPLHVYDGVPFGERPWADIAAIAEFFHAMGGTAGRFRFKDWADYKSCRIDGTISAADQPFLFTPGSPGGYQLVKRYIAAGGSSGSIVTTRTIRHPIGSTIRVSNQSGVEQDPSTWTIEEDTGFLVPGGGFTGTPGSWGGEFYVPARFAQDLDVVVSNFEIMSLSCSIRELRAEDS